MAQSKVSGFVFSTPLHVLGVAGWTKLHSQLWVGDQAGTEVGRIIMWLS